MTIDELGMGDAIARIPDLLVASARGADGLPNVARATPGEVVVIGRSVAGHATEFVNAALGPDLQAPLSFVPPSLLPRRLGAATLAIAVALSPADEVVLRGASAAAERGASVVVLAGGAEPATFASSARIVRRALPAVPRDRLSLYPVVAEILGLLEEAGVARDTAAMLEAAAGCARARIAGPFAYRSFGEEYARRLGRTFPLLVGAPGVGHAAARWWQAEMAANARVLAHAESTSEYRDALLAGFGQSGDVTRQVATLVLLRCAADPPEARSVFAAIEEWLSEAVSGILTLEAEGPGPLAQLVDLAVLGDLTSVALATSEGIDPGPSPVIDERE